jgi:NADPH:quinone reductase-like Zn-dependent oxidoreductase
VLKAVRFSQFGGPEVLEIVDLPDPHPGPGQVRIAVRAAGVNPSDWKKPKGLMDSGLPQTMGHEAADVVDELGEGVADVAIGDRVFGLSAEGAAQAELAGGTGHVVTVADFGGAQEHGVRFSSGDAGRAVHALGEIGELIESGRFWLPVAQTFPPEVAEAHRMSEQGHVRGKLVLLVG